MGSYFAEIVLFRLLLLLLLLLPPAGTLCGSAEAAGSVSSTEAARERYREGNWRQAVDLYQETEDSLGPLDLVRYGEALLEARQYDPARSVFQRVEEADPGDREIATRARAARFYLEAARGNLTESLDLLDALVEEEPESYWAHLYRGRALKRAQRREDALTDLYEAVRIVPRKPWAFFEIGEIYEALFLFDLAMEAYEESLFYNPRYAQAINNLGYCYKEKSVLYPGVTLYSYAVEKYLEAIAIQPDNAGFYYNVGNAYTHLGKLDRAFEAYSRAVELDPTFAKAHFNLGRTWQRFRRLDRAIEEFELYLKYGNQAIFDFVQQPDIVRAEIEAMRQTLEDNEDE